MIQKWASMHFGVGNSIEWRRRRGQEGLHAPHPFEFEATIDRKQKKLHVCPSDHILESLTPPFIIPF